MLQFPLFLRKEAENCYLIFNCKTYDCFYVNDIGYKILQLSSLSATEIAQKLGLEEREVKQFIEVFQNITSEHDQMTIKRLGNSLPSTTISLRAPIRVTFLITRRCNLMCKHCYIGSSPYDKSSELTFSQVESILKKLAEAGVFVIYFTGGEPFVRPDFIEIAELASDLGFGVGISTNGTLLDDNIISRLSNINIVKIQVSLDGARKETHEFVRGKDTFDKTITTIKKLVDYNIPVGITTVFHHKNINELEEILLLANKLKVKGVKISPLMDWGRAKHTLSEYTFDFEKRIELIKKTIDASSKIGMNLLGEIYIDVGFDLEPYGCPLTIGLTLLPNADVIPCEVFAENLRQEVILGNLLHQTVEEVWNSPKARDIRNAALIKHKKECNRCAYLDLCGSYCIAEMYLKFGNLSPPREYFKMCKKTYGKFTFNNFSHHG